MTIAQWYTISRQAEWGKAESLWIKCMMDRPGRDTRDWAAYGRGHGDEEGICTVSEMSWRSGSQPCSEQMCAFVPGQSESAEDWCNMPTCGVLGASSSTWGVGDNEPLIEEDNEPFIEEDGDQDQDQECVDEDEAKCQQHASSAGKCEKPHIMEKCPRACGLCSNSDGGSDGGGARHLQEPPSECDQPGVDRTQGQMGGEGAGPKPACAAFSICDCPCDKIAPRGTKSGHHLPPSVLICVAHLSRALMTCAVGISIGFRKSNLELWATLPVIGNCIGLVLGYASSTKGGASSAPAPKKEEFAFDSHAYD